VPARCEPRSPRRSTPLARLGIALDPVRVAALIA
jgi:hypothetical protein